MDEIADYIQQRKAEGLSPATLKTNESILKALAKFLDTRGNRRASDVTPEDLDAHMLAMFDAGVRLSTRQVRGSVIRAFFRWLAEAGKLLSNPARDILVPEDEDDVPLAEPPLEEAEVAEIIDGLPQRNAIDLRNRLHLELLYGCGLRIAESVGLDLRDIDLEARTLRIHGKGGKIRILPLMRGVQVALEYYFCLRRSLLKGPDHGALLLNKRGRRVEPSAVYCLLQVLNRQRGPGRTRLHPHLFRHSIAVHLLRGGADIRHIQEFLGHANLDITKRYLRLVPGRLKEDYDKAMPEIAVMA